MADYFVDSTTGSDLNSGTDMDNAWATMEKALETGGLVAGDYVWIRRVHSEIPTTDIVVAYGGTMEEPIHIIGWPRDEASGTGATWTNGSTTVDLVTGLSIDREKHLSRVVVGPDEGEYILTRVVDSNTFIIDRPYGGDTVTLTDGAFTIEQDDHWDTAHDIDDSGWTITKATWDADADDMPLINFNNTAYQLVIASNDRALVFFNIDFQDTTDTNGFFYAGGYFCILAFHSCLFKNSNNVRPCYMIRSTVAFDQCIIENSGAGTKDGVTIADGSHCSIKDSAIYNVDRRPIFISFGGRVYLENVNLNIEVDPTCVYDIEIYGVGHVYGRDVWLSGGGSKEVYLQIPGYSIAHFENYNKALGAHKTFLPMGTATKVDVVAGSGDPMKRADGSDSVIELLFDETGTGSSKAIESDFLEEDYQTVFVHEFEVDTTSKSYRYYVQAEGAVTADELWLECEFVGSYDADDEYSVIDEESDESISARISTSDWTQYIEVTGIEPAVAGRVRIKCWCRYYHATNKIYIDPLPEIT